MNLDGDGTMAEEKEVSREQAALVLRDRHN
jgi:hypothetical protein